MYINTTYMYIVYMCMLRTCTVLTHDLYHYLGIITSSSVWTYSLGRLTKHYVFVILETKNF